MQWHQLTKSVKQKNKKRVGRGGKRGTYSGRGVKGQKARAGRKIRPEWRDALKSIPKRRGYKFGSANDRPAVLNLKDLTGFFPDGGLVSPKVLLAKGLVKKIKNRLPEIKILGSGEINVKLNLEGLAASQSAKTKIEQAGGTMK
ncbi:MAG: uL15 family ribosomal protein [Candidatus Portnoybacteria bacterium]|jgi:large subunit ribosomal protein L15|nr:uL15 family ribosomal protein [Candidatus Portnoybacteria bacterium]